MCAETRMERFAALLLVVLMSVRIGSAQIILSEISPETAQIPGSERITVLNVSSTKELPSTCTDETPCFPKCCPFGESVVDKKCTPTNYSFEPRYWVGNDTYYSLFEEDGLPFYIIIGNPCLGERFIVYPNESWVLENGTMVWAEDSPNGVVVSTEDDAWVTPDMYCLDAQPNPMEGAKGIITFPLQCLPEMTRMGGHAPLHVVVYPIGLLVSVSFLLLTMAVYLAVPDLRDLHGKSLVCHVSCQAAAYTFLAAVQLTADGFGESSCRMVAYIIQFMFLGSFFWLNVLCFDALWCIIVATAPGTATVSTDTTTVPAPCRRLRYPGAKTWVKVNNEWMTGLEFHDEKSAREKKEKEKRFENIVFCGYSAYAWFFAFLPVVLILVMGLSPTIPHTYLEYNLVSYNCNFKQLADVKSMPYFYIPIGTILILNIFMFAGMFLKSHNFSWKTTGNHRVPKQKGRMCFMLFFLMSLNWLTDIISWANHGANFTWSVLNVFNILQGVVTFCIFVLEVRVKCLVSTKLLPKLKSIKTKYACCDVEQPQEPEFATENTNMLQNSNRKSVN